MGSDKVKVRRPGGGADSFVLVNGVWTPDPDVTSRLEKSSDGLMWIYTLPDNTRELFNTSKGLLTSIRNPYGQLQTLTYDSYWRSFTVSGPEGDSLSVTLDSTTYLPIKITDAQGRITSYTYAGPELNKVTYPDSKTKQYLYEVSAKQHLITGIVDENGHRSNNVTYDSQGRAVMSELADGVERVEVTYNSDGTTTLINALGKRSTFTFQSIQGVRKIVHVEGEPTATCQGTAKDYAYDTNGFLIQKTDARGTVTQYTRDTRGLELSRTEAYGTPEARTTTTQWDTTKRLPLSITEANRQTTFTYDSDGRLLTRTITDTTLGQSRTTSYSYTTSGVIETVNGPRTDVSDITTYGYNTNGSLATVTNALGHVTTIVSRDYQGKPTLIRDANGLETALGYDIRGRLITTTTGGETTTFTYDFAGNVTKVTPPGGAVLNYAYDNADRLITITDASGNYLSYTLDLQGNRTSEKVYDASNNLLRSQTRVYDELSRLIRSLGAAGQTTQYGYDKNDNLVTTTDPLSQLYQSAYDPLNRLIQQTDPLNGTTAYGYDTLDRLTTVTDPNGHTTTYSYNGLGDLITQTSPDTGTTTFNYDSAGNLLSRTDANGQVTTYSYDALNRLTQQLHADGSITTYDYDTAVNGLGRLTVSSSPSGTTSYSYDSHGRVATRVESIANNSQITLLTTGYSYNANGQLQTMTYPSGKALGYQYDSKGQLTGLTLDGQPLLSGITWSPFGPVKGWTWSNGQTYQRTFNQDGQLTSHSQGADTKTLSYDATGNITAIGSALYSYDAINRLIAANDLYFGYDANGNRTSMGSGWGNIAYTIDAASNKMLAAGASTYQYDSTGSLLNDSINSYQYDAQGRLTRVNNGTTGHYSYNAQGQRVYKWGLIQGAAEERLFAYDGWKLLGEYGPTGIAVQETVWLGDLPIATLQNGSVYNIHPDHLGTPRVITNAANTVIWKWESDPFGAAPANDDPDGDSVKFTYNLRFAGQYFDAETGKHYNYFRDYDPPSGRYIESDPIGLRGGLNTYAYVENDPITYFDPLGLKLWYADKASEAAMKSHIATMMKTSDGRKLLKQLNDSATVYKIHEGQGPHGPAYYDPSTNEVYVDPTFAPTIQTDMGPKTASTTRILAHELGHCTGSKDDGPNNMNNVNAFENPIMGPLEGYLRTQY
jgi:RHS repeat-associated protein